jgi:hypothetical protein
MRNVILPVSAFLLAASLVAFAPNTAWRKLGTVDCTVAGSSCGRTDASTEFHENYKVSFVEFSERGNLFDRRIYEDVLSAA